MGSLVRRMKSLGCALCPLREIEGDLPD